MEDIVREYPGLESQVTLGSYSGKACSLPFELLVRNFGGFRRRYERKPQ
jgi:hypothetical protein